MWDFPKKAYVVFRCTHVACVVARKSIWLICGLYHTGMHLLHALYVHVSPANNQAALIGHVACVLARTGIWLVCDLHHTQTRCECTPRTVMHTRCMVCIYYMSCMCMCKLCKQTSCIKGIRHLCSRSRNHMTVLWLAWFVCVCVYIYIYIYIYTGMHLQHVLYVHCM